MDHEEKTLEFAKIVTRAKRAGLLKAEYPEHGIAILLLPAKPPAENPPALQESENT